MTKHFHGTEEKRIERGKITGSMLCWFLLKRKMMQVELLQLFPVKGHKCLLWNWAFFLLILGPIMEINGIWNLRNSSLLQVPIDYQKC